MEKKLTELFENITPEELSLAGDETRIEQKLTAKEQERILSLTRRKAGITMTDKTQKAKRHFKRTSIIAIAAAAVLSCTAAAAGIIAVHEKSVDRYFGEGAAAELAKKGIMINKVETNDDYKLTVDLAYATDDYARVMFTFEGLNDAAKERIANTRNWYDYLTPHFKDDSKAAMSSGGGALGDLSYHDENKKDRENGIFSRDITICTDLSNIDYFTLSIVPEEWSETNGFPNPEGEINVISMDFELTPNITPVCFKTEAFYSNIWLCDYELSIPDAWQEIPYYYYIPESVGWFPDEGEPTKEEHNAEYEAHKNDPCLTFVYKDGSKQVLKVEDIIVGSHVFFKNMTIDSENVEKIIVGDGKIEYTRK